MSETTKFAGPLDAYMALVADGSLQCDSAQKVAAEKLQSLWHNLIKYEPAGVGRSWQARFGLMGRLALTAPRGLYLHGAVGRPERQAAKAPLWREPLWAGAARALPAWFLIQ